MAGAHGARTAHAGAEAARRRATGPLRPGGGAWPAGLEPPRAERVARVLVLGLGNPILGDDGVGWQVAGAVEALLATGPRSDGVLPARLRGRVEVDRLSLGGLRLMERLIGYDRAIIVDAIATGLAPLGTVRARRLAELPDPAQGRLASPHDSSLAVALAVGRELGARLPREPWIVAVEAAPGMDFGEGLSPPVRDAVPRAAAEVIRLLRAATRTARTADGAFDQRLTPAPAVRLVGGRR